MSQPAIAVNAQPGAPLKVNRSLPVIWQPTVNRAIDPRTNLRTYGDAFNFLNVMPSRGYPDNFFTGLNRRFALEYHPDRCPNDPAATWIMAGIPIAIDGARRYSSSRLLLLSDPINMTPSLKVRLIAGDIAGTAALFVVDEALFNAPFQHMNGNGFDWDTYFTGLRDSSMSALNLGVTRTAGTYLFGLDATGANTLAFGSAMVLGPLKSLEDQTKGIGIAGATVNLSAFIGSQAAIKPLAVKVCKTPGKTGLLLFFIGDLSARFASTGLEKFYGTELGYGLMNSDLLSRTGRYAIPVLDWTCFSYSFTGSLNPSKFSAAAMAAKKAPLVGSLITAAGVTMGNFDLLISCDPWTMTGAGYNVAREAGKAYVSTLAATAAAGATFETGLGAFAVGAGTYIATDLALDAALSKAERASGLRSFFETKMVAEPLGDIGISFKILDRGKSRPAFAVAQQSKVTIAELRLFITGKQKLPDRDNTGKKIMINLKDELHGSGITSIAAENIRDLQPVVILQAIRLIKEIIEAPKNIHLKLRYKETEATSDGTCMAFSVEADDLSKEQSAKLSAARVLMPVEPIIDDDNIGLEEILMGKRQLANGTVEDLKPQRLDDDFFTRPNIAITQVSKVLYALGYFADFPNTQEKTDFIAAVSSTSLKQLKRALKNDTQRRTARTMMEGSLERFIDSCMKMPLLFQERPSHLDPRTLWLLQLIFESRRDGLSDSAKLLSDLLVREILGKEDPSSEDYLKAKKELGALRLNISREITRLRAETKGKQSASTDKKARELQEALLKTDELAGLLDDREKYAARLLSKLFADIEESLRK